MYEFFVEAVDNGRPNRHTTVTVQFRIIEMNALTPEFLSKIYTLTVTEDTLPGNDLFIFH